MRPLIVCLWFCLLTLQINAQIKIHKNISTADGLINNEVKDIFQDGKGYIWFATMGGISRWDGKYFDSYTQDNGLEYFQTFNIYEDKNSNLYFATFGRSIVKIVNNTIDTLSSDDGFNTNFVMKIFSLENEGIIFCGADATVTKFRDGKFSIWDLGLKGISTVYDLTYDNNELLIATHDFGLAVKSDKGIKYYDSQNSSISNLIWDIQKLKDNSILIGSGNGVFKYTEGKVIKSTKYGRTIEDDIRKILESSNGNIYYATNKGLYCENENTFELINEENGLSNNSITSIHETKEGQILIGTEGNGADIYWPNKLENIDNPIIRNKKITSLNNTRDNKLIIGTKSGLIIGDKGQYKLMNIHDGLSGNSITDIYVDDKVIYAGTENSGISIIKDGKIIFLKKENGLLNDRIVRIKKSPNGELFVGSIRGVSIIEDANIRNLNIRDGLIGNFNNDFIFLDDGSILFGSHGKGISILKNKKFSYLTEENGLISNSVNVLFKTSEDAVLIGTEQKGLNILKFGLLDTITTADGLTSNQIKSIAEDKSGNIYLATPHGINILQFVDRDFTIRTLTKEDGLPSNDCNYLFVDSSNHVWIGSAAGVTKYNPDFDPPQDNPPLPILLGIELFNKPFPIDEIIKRSLDYDENYIKFNYSAINTASPNKTFFEYRLIGVDRGWVTSKENIVQYTSLDNGSYTFEVKAKNEWGYWSEPTKLSFTINPAWWETWWFYTISTFTILAFVAFIASNRYRNLLAIEKIRTKISTDLHDNIGSGLTEITFLSEMVKHQVKGNEKTDKGLNNITEISKTLIDDMRDIVWLVNPSKDTLKDLFNRLQDSYQEVLKYSNISLVINGINNLDNVSLPMNFRQHIFLMFKEAINNSIKYSRCKNIEINVKTYNKTLMVDLTDDGIGFDINNTKLGNGIKNIKKRAKAVKGEIQIDSELNRGTKIRFSTRFGKTKITKI